MSNGYLEKIAAEYSTPPKEDSRVSGAVVGATGAAVAGSVLSDKGIYELSGRHTYYHGTSSKNAEAIKKGGIVPHGSRGIIDEVNDRVTPNFRDLNKGLVFATKSPAQARVYANQSSLIEKGGPRSVMLGYERSRQIGDLKAAFGVGKGEVLTVRAPKSTLYKRKVSNPEYTNMSAFQRLLDPHAKEMLEDSVLTHKGRIPSNFIKGSPNYTSISAKEVARHLRENPKNIGKAGARILAGSAIMYGGGRMAGVFGSKDLQKTAGTATDRTVRLPQTTERGKEMKNIYLEKIAQLYDESGNPVSNTSGAATAFLGGAAIGGGVTAKGLAAKAADRKAALLDVVGAQQDAARGKAEKGFRMAAKISTPAGANDSPNKLRYFTQGQSSMDRAIALSNRASAIRGANPMTSKKAITAIGKGAGKGLLVGGALYGAYKGVSGN